MTVVIIITAAIIIIMAAAIIFLMPAVTILMMVAVIIAAVNTLPCSLFSFYASNKHCVRKFSPWPVLGEIILSIVHMRRN